MARSVETQPGYSERAFPRLDRGQPAPVVGWLLASTEPAVRFGTLTEVLGRPENDADVRAARAAIPDGPKVRALRSGQQADGGFGVHPYQKWSGAFWRLIALADLRCPGDELISRAADTVLEWLDGKRPRTINGLVRRDACQEGFTLAACVRLGVADDGVAQLAEKLVQWQWPDGGWNCDTRPEAHHSSFHESLGPLWGLSEYRRLTGDGRVDASIRRAADLFLRKRLFLSERTGDVIDRKWLNFRYPPYWHYDVLAGLRVLEGLDLLGDPRAQPALDLVERRRRPDGTWAAAGRWWRSVGPPFTTYAEVVDWGTTGPNEMVTLHALGVLRAAGRT